MIRGKNLEDFLIRLAESFTFLSGRMLQVLKGIFNKRDKLKLADISAKGVFFKEKELLFS